ncbi:hypothetical protein [Clostridium hydrogenum]|uniref:hypothetical protein n=1 Tax=Clostridium hydrogenum TaxID=2855764 RepID=UPI001F233566|nr:hypothetical protein [Clostridium hydrogenum]
MKIDAYYKDIENYILKWNASNERYLNVVSPPYNTEIIFLNLIIRNILDGNKVLYITGENEKNVGILEHMINKKNCKNHVQYYNGKKLHENNKFIICNHENALKLNCDFKLVIYNDIKSFPQYNQSEIISLLKKFNKENCKCIAYSIEAIFKNYKTIHILTNYNRMPVIEPRVISTRININRDMPFLIYEYLKWFVYEKRNVIIPILDTKIMTDFFKYLISSELNLDGKIFMYNKYSTKKSELKSTKGAIIITNDFDAVCTQSKNVSIAVFFYVNNTFNYKTLVYFCGKTGGGLNKRGEVIFVTNKENKQIKMAKNITRNFNKLAWEKGLFSI